MNDKYKASIDKNIWEVILPPPDANIVGSHWTYVCKTNPIAAAAAPVPESPFGTVLINV